MVDDAIDAVVAQWRRERPDLDPSGKEVTARVVRLAGELHRRFGEAFAPLGITGPQFGVLSALRRAGAPFELTPTELARTQVMTSGGMTPLIDSLERIGLVARRPNPDDRRGRLVRLTAAGRKKIDQAMRVHATTERTFVAGLTEAEQARLAGLLRKLLLSVES